MEKCVKERERDYLNFTIYIIIRCSVTIGDVWMIKEQVVSSKSQLSLEIILLKSEAFIVLGRRKSRLEISGVVGSPLIVTLWTGVIREM